LMDTFCVTDYRSEESKSIQFNYIFGCFACFGLGIFSQEGVRVQCLISLSLYLPKVVHFLLCAYYFNTTWTPQESPICAIFTLLSFIGFSLNAYFSWHLGSGDLSRVTKLINGQYQVGVKRIWTQNKGQAALVFYPMDKQDYIDSIEENNMLWHDENSLEIFDAMSNMTTMGFAPRFCYGASKMAYIDCVKNGKLSKDFQGKKALRPMVFSHGLSANKEGY
jgi:hypothetical protein